MEFRHLLLIVGAKCYQFKGDRAIFPLMPKFDNSFRIKCRNFLSAKPMLGNQHFIFITGNCKFYHFKTWMQLLPNWSNRFWKLNNTILTNYRPKKAIENIQFFMVYWDCFWIAWRFPFDNVEKINVFLRFCGFPRIFADLPLTRLTARVNLT